MSLLLWGSLAAVHVWPVFRVAQRLAESPGLGDAVSLAVLLVTLGLFSLKLFGFTFLPGLPRRVAPLVFLVLMGVAHHGPTAQVEHRITGNEAWEVALTAAVGAAAAAVASPRVRRRLLHLLRDAFGRLRVALLRALIGRVDEPDALNPVLLVLSARRCRAPPLG